MARIASQSKGGYYPTPMEEIELILPHLKIQNTEEARIVNVYDPCCGEGEALKLMSQAIQNESEAEVVTYGVELEKGRAEVATNTLDHVLCEGYELVRTQNKFGAMWLNPPYDILFKERTELRFLRTLTSKSKNVLQQNGLLMFCIPQYVLKNCAMILSSRFRDVKVYRFTDANYPVYKQVVVFGRFLKPNAKEKKETNAMLKELAQVDPKEIPTLEEINEVFTIPANEESIEIFRAGTLNIEELVKDLEFSPVLDEFNKQVSSKKSRAIMKRPILPLKSTHAGVAVASGAIGGNLGNHIVTGVTKPKTSTQPMFDDSGKQYGEKRTMYYTSAVRVFTPAGIHELN
ncbi:DUF6094 domain-containing protein [Priestia sp. YIM B13551]|uniref:DUF6094 domain-containing protein n=1 Tax=Priestia sp. YIM B13551 TaxID=3366306 RepID=UPI00367293C1